MRKPTWIAAAVAGLAASATAGAEPWMSVIEPRQLVFPRDHAAHEDYRIEWWYYTGNLQTAAGRQFGYQLTFFRTGLAPQPTSPSRWAIRDLYVAHFAVSDVEAQQLHCFQRANRRGVGWAGAATDRLQVWNGSWEVRLAGENHLVKAEDGRCQIEFTLRPARPPVMHGEAGMTRKGSSPGNASYYYSLTRMLTAGSLTVDGTTHTVTGASWMDHEFSSSFLEEGQQGWDWLSIQLDDGRELMLYRIRQSDAAASPYSLGTIVGPDGTAESIGGSQFTLVPGRRWRSADTGAEYPIQWTLESPRRDIKLDIQAAFANQEMNTVASTGFPYWEGSVRVQGTWSGRLVAGRGYLEMTGYHGPGLRIGLPQEPAQ